MRISFLSLFLILLLFGCFGIGTNEKPDISSLLFLKAKIAEQFNPGICFGIPSPVSDSSISEFFKEYPEEVKFAKTYFKPLDNLSLFIRVYQMNHINIYSLNGDSDLVFSFDDGRCCTVHHYTGKIIKKTDKIDFKITNVSVEIIPC